MALCLGREVTVEVGGDAQLVAELVDVRDGVAIRIGVDRVGQAIHPMVIRHPESGRKVLYVNPGHTIGIEGWSREESFALLNFLYAHAEQDQFTCRFNWLPGSIAFWDKCCVQHFGVPDYSERRVMHRVTIDGDEPC